MQLRQHIPQHTARKRLRSDRDIIAVDVLPDDSCDAHPESVGSGAPVVELDLERIDATTGVGDLLVPGQNIARGG